ncbi:MAG: hypothetical protein COU90_01105 [Candidatus Ryanbacteria bacterium CG10_big_fil_rev_8_21_14_0_10_43_42]|uniref:Uncharacterized protein n=1 Tax=Candidatus Ryanbacteria bacterium CG10_big_fil_rev_8_21_14_0_10_43_42 TaxID=1974864 RepID=A0A2M8KY31_9BACT|nr:MAG: hypothetical protein COU90_01105 [Candidatus Ryanbacteria bacterium CG10_big_fil_rev_8_21_14_0_10_43_42]
MRKKNTIFSELTGYPSTVVFIIVTLSIAFMLAIHQYDIQNLKRHINTLERESNAPANIINKNDFSY